MRNKPLKESSEAPPCSGLKTSLRRFGVRFKASQGTQGLTASLHLPLLCFTGEKNKHSFPPPKPCNLKTVTFAETSGQFCHRDAVKSTLPLHPQQISLRPWMGVGLLPNRFFCVEMNDSAAFCPPRHWMCVGQRVSVCCSSDLRPLAT